MTVLKHEIRQGRTAFLIWTCAIASLLAVCIFLYPEMKDEMGNVTDMFASMGAFSAAFGMDRLNFESLIGFFSVECGNVLGLGGGLFASMLAAGMLSKEEKDKTAEFLLTHPVSRVRVLLEKLAAVLLQITFMNLIIYAVSIGAVYAIGEDIPWRELNLMLLAYYLMQLELAGICFGISAFMKRGSLGAGLGIAAVMYFLNIIANIAEAAEPLKYITPFSYCEGADIVENGALDGTLFGIGIVIGIAGVVIAFARYTKRDIS